MLNLSADFLLHVGHIWLDFTVLSINYIPLHKQLTLLLLQYISINYLIVGRLHNSSSFEQIKHIIIVINKRKLLDDIQFYFSQAGLFAIIPHHLLWHSYAPLQVELSLN